MNSSDSERIAQSGRVVARRLTRAQYQRSVNRLLGMDNPLEEYLPADSLDDGFGTVSTGQQISDHLMAAYLRAANVAIQTAVEGTIARDPYKVRFNWTKLRRREKNGSRTRG